MEHRQSWKWKLDDCCWFEEESKQTWLYMQMSYLTATTKDNFMTRTPISNAVSCIEIRAQNYATIGS